MSQRFIARLTTFRSFVTGSLTLIVLTLALAPRAEAFVYWSATDTADHIGRANLDGTGVDQRYIRAGRSLAVGPCGLAVDAAHLYWGSPSNFNLDLIGRANLDGTGVDQSFITGPEAASWCGVAVDAMHVYWSSSGSIGRANLDGTGVDQSFITGATRSYGVAVDAAHLYWASRTTPAFNRVSRGNVRTGSIGRANLDGTGVDLGFITGAKDPCGVAVDATHVYWADWRKDRIGRAKLDGTDVDHRFITGASHPCWVAVDESHLYWGHWGTQKRTFGPKAGAIGRAKLNGTGVDQRFIDRPGFGPLGVTVDALRSFSFGNVKRNKEKGTANLAVKVPGPGEVELAETKTVKPKRKRAEAAGKVKLPINPRREANKRLERKGKAKVEAEVTYTPTDGDLTIVANTDTKTVKLIKR